MLGLIAGFGLSLAVARVHFLLGVALTSVWILLIAATNEPPLKKRAMIYGAMGTVSVLVIGAVSYAYNSPWQPYAHHYASLYVRPYAFPVGGFLGAMIAGTLVDWYREGRRQRLARLMRPLQDERDRRTKIPPPPIETTTGGPCEQSPLQRKTTQETTNF